MENREYDRTPVSGGAYQKPAATQPAEPRIGKALDEQDTLIQQTWQVIHLLRERLEVVSSPQPPNISKGDAVNRPTPDRFLDRIQQNNRAINEQSAAIGEMMNRLAL